jgi:hypothetical protein
VSAAPARRYGLLSLALLVVVASLGSAWAQRAAAGRRALADADAALARGDAVEAIFAARVAAEARCPGCRAPDEGFARLEKVARDAEARGDDPTAFAAWRATRAALLGAAVTTTRTPRRVHADNEIARFAHRLDAAQVAAGATPTLAATEEQLRATLTASEVPSGATFALVALGALLLAVAAARLAVSQPTRGLDLGLAAAGVALSAAGALLF